MAKSKRTLMASHIGSAVKQKAQTESNIKKDLIIKEELKEFIPPLTNEEFLHLEENIIQEGCRDALVIWKNGEEFILVDGHNRYQICSKHKIDFKFVFKEFLNIEQVKEWMVANQLGKRNLTENAKAFLRGSQYLIEKRNKEDNLVQNRKDSSGQDVPSGNTAEKIGKENKISGKTVKRNAQYAQGINKLVDKDNQLKWKILNKDLDIPQKIIEGFVKKSEAEIHKFRQTLMDLGVVEALKTLDPNYTGKTPKANQAKTKPEGEVEVLQSGIVSTVKKLSKHKDRKALEELKSLVAQLEKALFG